MNNKEKSEKQEKFTELVDSMEINDHSLNSKTFSDLNVQEKVDRGLCGLVNLGNTCFMNSAIQCLSNTVSLREYFLSGKFRTEINRNNPIGMKGKMAEAFADLIEKLWSGEYSSIAPKSFQVKLAQFAPRFLDFRQHDSQELLAFLLDALHEDLNRVTTKPYKESVETDEEIEEHKLASIQWSNHLERNNSIIVDIFQGQLKSIVVCPTCNKRSKTFDPFMFLSLPLPQKESTFHITATHTKGYITQKYCLTIPKQASIAVMRQRLSQKMKLPPSSLIFVEVEEHKLLGFPEDLTALSNFQKENLHVFVVSEDISDGIVGKITLPVFQRVMRPTRAADRVLDQHQIHSHLPYPFCISISRNLKVVELYKIIWEKVEKIIKEGNKIENFEDISCFLQLKISSPIGNNKEISLPLEEEASVVFKDNSYLIIEWDLRVFNKKIYDIKKAETIVSESNTQEANSNPATLYSCLELFSTEEELGENDMWYCSSCKEHKQATKQLGLWKLPPILIIQLKRFSYLNHIWRDKIDIFCDFPIFGLDLSTYIQSENSCVYDLFAVSNHYGGLIGGHYTTYAFNTTLNQWFEFDDSSCNPIKETEIKSKDAYLLFYKRRNK